MTLTWEGNFPQENNNKYLSLENVIGFEKIVETLDNLRETAPSGMILYNLGRCDVKLSYDPSTIAAKPLIIEEVSRSQSNSRLDISVKVRNHIGFKANSIVDSLGTDDYAARIRFENAK